MERRKLGQLEVSVVGLGTNSFGTTFATPVDSAGARAVIHGALDAGINFIDTADVYGDSEEFIGEALQGRRQEAVLATKFGGQVGPDPTSKGASARWIVQAVEGSLRRLRTDHIDLYQLHFPDPESPLDDTLTALDQLVTDGKVLEIGCSNFSGELIDTAVAISESRGLRAFASAQNDLSVLRSKTLDDVVPACARHDMGVIPYGPLASGLLTGKYRRGEEPAPDTRLGHSSPERLERTLSERTFDRLERLDAFATQHGHTLLELAFGWLLAIPQVVSVIAGATRPEQARANVDAASWVLSPQEFEEATQLAQG